MLGGMPDTTIATEEDVMTLINVFTVDPGRQQELVDLLVEATDALMRELPGFVSANIHWVWSPVVAPAEPVFCTNVGPG